MSNPHEESRRLLPSSSALATFVRAARDGSFSRAGDALGLTQSAVSRQIAELEARLRVRLFARQGRRVALTPAGAAYAAALEPALAAIRRATARVSGEGQSRPLAIATLPSFGMRWLAPRLPALTTRHAEIVVSFSARSDVFDFGVEEVDAAIHFGRDDWPGAACDFLFGERIVAVAAPALLRDRPVASAADVARLPLLSQVARRSAWGAWFAARGVAAPPDPVGLVFDHFLMVAQAAAAGTGVALLPDFLVGPEIASGALFAPLPATPNPDGAYWLVYPPGRLEDARFRRFRRWIIDEAAAMPQAAIGPPPVIPLPDARSSP